MGDDGTDRLGALLRAGGPEVRVVYDGPAALEAFADQRPLLSSLHVGR